ncbi:MULTISPECIES: hypothetical protein [unclassified Paenibacillus]|uniref:hypothetical protein n=1 Tax=unclassified Paenibacillus TaxID=185978 RepID=UPI0009AEEC19|nr:MULTISPECIES: hypothetical protein [unclassified Paenibacillus]MBE1446431.1 hypothetical protein [Paenibacillus sp. OAS669]
MLKNRSLLFGLGLGLIAGALLLQVMNIAVSPQQANGLELQELDKQKLKEAASKYFQVNELDQKLYNQAQADALVQQKLKEEKEKQAANAPAQAAKEPAKETYIFISKGLTAGNVADLLQQSGVISDRKAFEDAMYKQQLNDKIVAGVHVFKGPQDLTQVLTNLTSQ